MQRLLLENDSMKIEVSSLGAELQSLYSKKTKQEYLWQPGGEIWPHHSMLLFPNPGRIAQDRILVDGKIYPAMMHGFAYDADFEMLHITKNEVWLELKDSEYTRRYFPYEFRLQVGFRLDNDQLFQTFRVLNDSERTMYFSIGAHPGFYCPIALGECGDDYSLVFDCPQNIDCLELDQHTRLLTGKRVSLLKAEKEIKLGEHFFDEGPLLLEGIKANSITLRSCRSGSFVEMGIKNFPYMCLWGPPGKMSLIAIEPWCGTSDLLDTDHVWERKLGIESVEPGQAFERVISFRMGSSCQTFSDSSYGFQQLL